MIAEAEQPHEPRHRAQGPHVPARSPALRVGMSKDGRLLVNPLTGRYNAIRFPVCRFEMALIRNS
jgi:hypothetical protein